MLKVVRAQNREILQSYSLTVIKNRNHARSVPFSLMAKCLPMYFDVYSQGTYLMDFFHHDRIHQADAVIWRCVELKAKTPDGAAKARK
jgi:hypothetical protein